VLTISGRLKNILHRATHPEHDSPLSLQYWRERILGVIYLTVAVFGVTAYLPSVFLSLKEEIWWLAFFNTLGYVWFLCAAFSRRFAFRTKAAVLLLFIYVLGVTLIFRLGPFAAGPFWLFVFPVMAGLLFGMQVALVCLVLNALTVFGFGLVMATSQHTVEFVLPNMVAKWWVISANFILLDTVVTLSLAMLLRGLKKALDRQRQIQQSLEDKHAELQDANLNLTREITERQRAQNELKSSHEILLTVVDSIDADIFVADMDTHEILLMNRHMQDNYGGDRSGELCWRVFKEEKAACPQCPVTKLVDAEGQPTGLHLWEYHSAATGRQYLNFDRAIHWTDGRLVQLQIAMDITELTRIQKEKLNLEIQLRQAQKMEAIGTLAGGIAHDFNNILAAIIGYTEISMEVGRSNTQIVEYLREVMTAAHRAKDLTAQILTFSRQAEVEPRPMRLGHVVREAVKLIRASLPSTITIEETIKSKTPIIADPTQMHQVVMNLATNAAHAMEDEGGRLTIELDDVDLRAGGRPIDGLAACDQAVELIVRDTGKGMPASVCDRIFDPYFTTKAKGKGTGMGLAVVHGIITSFGGEIQVESQPGQGSAFHILLPVAEALRLDARHDPSAEEAAPGAESILLVDDEPQIVSLLEIMLASLGYRVLAFTDSLKALAAFEANPWEFQLVLTDMTMPGITGQELARRVLQIRPGLPVVLTTGYSEQINEDKAHRMGISKFLFKPVLRNDLARVLREALDDTRGRQRPEAIQ
jgi:signal transduction histidine kinase/ActR/RegA family two-component response regulator